MSGWIGIDLDGTLAKYTPGSGGGVIGKPVPAMLARVRAWLTRGYEVRVCTARAGTMEGVIQVRVWLDAHGLEGVAVTDRKDYDMIELWDDRAVRVEANTGRRISDSIIEDETCVDRRSR